MSDNPTSEATLHIDAEGQPSPSAETGQYSENFAESVPSSPHLDGQLAPELGWPDVKLRRGGSGETLAVLALLVPLLAQGFALACGFESSAIGMALGVGTVVITALVLALDAALLGNIDLQGTRRSGPGAVFVGIIVLWIVYYPAAFFRRRHFGQPNLGPLAILVVVFFVGVPVVQQFRAFGVLGTAVPTCTCREVTGMVDDMIRKSPIGPSVESISGHREISYDKVNQTRKGQCLVKTQKETITAAYSVKLLNRAAGTFQVDVEPINFADPAASCTSPEVKEMVEDMIRQSPKGQQMQSVGQYRETHCDPATKTRTGECQVKTATGEFAVTYQVKPINDKWFEVKILGGLDQPPMIIRWEPGQPWQQPDPQWRQPGQPWPQPGQQWRRPGQPWPQQKLPGQPWPPKKQFGQP
jgi:hypothetical protein